MLKHKKSSPSIKQEFSELYKDALWLFDPRSHDKTGHSQKESFNLNLF